MFQHPRDSRMFPAQIDPQCTGGMALEGLMIGDENGPFIEKPPTGRPYELALARTAQAITPNMKFAQVGVVDGDVVEIRQAGQGA